MVLVRPVRLDDLDSLIALASRGGFGLTSLPKTRDLLDRRIHESLNSFGKTGEESRRGLYVFVMEDSETGAVVGTSCIMSKAGATEPFYAYKLQTSLHESETLSIRKEIQTLNLIVAHDGPSEIGGLFLAPEYRKHGAGRLLSLARFLFMVEHSQQFQPRVIAEMRGVVDDQGTSPFWEALGRHFFDMDYPKADYLTLVDKRFIADLMPTCPIYVPLLPKAAQEVIGEVHEQTRPALKLLKDEGFEFSGLVDIFEAGPVIHCKLNDIRIVRESRRGTVEQTALEGIQSTPFLVVTVDKDFRACVGPLEVSDDGIKTNADVARILGLSAGDAVRFASLFPAKPGTEKHQ
jgi:arginine N-succinyltransferase